MPSGQSFTCPQCGKQFPFKPELIGKKVRCKCGHVFVASAPAPAPASDTYDIADDAPAPPPPRPAAVTNPLQPQIDPNSRVLPYRAKPQPPPEEQALEASHNLKNFYLPIALVIIGVGFRIGQLVLPSARDKGILIAIFVVLGGIILNVVLMLAAVVVAARLTDADFGPLNRAVLKLTAMAILAGGVAGFFISLDWGSGYNGPIIAIHAVMFLYFIMFQMFFELDLLENLMTVVIVTAFQMAALCVALGKMHL